jgi:hypothetical protein
LISDLRDLKQPKDFVVVIEMLLVAAFRTSVNFSCFWSLQNVLHLYSDKMMFQYSTAQSKNPELSRAERGVYCHLETWKKSNGKFVAILKAYRWRGIKMTAEK